MVDWCSLSSDCVRCRGSGTGSACILSVPAGVKAFKQCSVFEADPLLAVMCRYYNADADNKARKQEGIQSAGQIPTAQQ